MRRLCSCAVAVMLAMIMCSCCTKKEYTIGADETSWPDSAEFSTLATGQGRFSVHDSNEKNVLVLVDRQTGVQYLVTLTGTCPLLDADGSPLLVLEAGE